LCRTAGLFVVNGALLVLTTPLAVVREDPLFWRNAGGWPVWLRDLVNTAFYPLFGGQLAVMVLISGLVLYRRSLARWRKQTWPLALLMWLWIAGIVALITANNLGNYLEGRPLHWHPN
jgi:hypothetical protein